MRFRRTRWLAFKHSTKLTVDETCTPCCHRANHPITALLTSELMSCNRDRKPEFELGAAALTTDENKWLIVGWPTTGSPVRR